MTQTDVKEMIKFCFEKGFSERRTATGARGLKLKHGRMELYLTIVPCSNSMFYATNLPLHCFGRNGMRCVDNSEYGTRVINALVTRFEKALLQVKAKYKLVA